MKTRIDGKSISESFALVAACGTEIESLCESLTNQLTMELKDPAGELRCVIADKSEEHARLDASGWVYTDVSHCLPLKPKGKGNKSVDRYLSFQISLLGNGVPDSVDEPVVHICLWPYELEFGDDGEDVDFMSFPPDMSQNPVLVDGRLWTWEQDPKEPHEHWSGLNWTFTVRLLSLNSPDDLHDLCVKPAIKLLKSGAGAESVKAALPDELFERGLVKYPNLM